MAAVVDAVVTAGGIPRPGESLYPLTQGKSKALLPIGGVPMVQWVIDALGNAATVRRVVVVGVPDDTPLEYKRTLACLPNQGAMIPNIEAGAKWVLGQDASAQHILVVSADIPALIGEVVDWVVNTSLETDHEAYYSMIPAANMERRFPGSNRSFFKLKDGKFTGSDVNLFRLSLVGNYHPAWNTIVDSRKNVFKQASLVGLDTLFLLAAGQLSIAEAERRAGQRLKIRGRVLICPYAEAGMDVDKPAQYALLKRELETRGRRV